VDGEITVYEEGEAGRSVAVEDSIRTITEALRNGESEAALVIESQEPQLRTPAIENISLDDVLAEASTYYGDSSDARRHNVEVASALESGWLIAPGEQFSYAEFIGAVDEESGFVTGFGIVDDPSGEGVTTAPVVGGGICQVSTTIFQAAFWSGMQIDERYSHPYWIQTYGEPPRGMEGLDAMVNIEESGSLDLKFTNTTGNWIAVEVIADGTTVTVRILGTDPGWNIDVGQPVISNEVEPSTETRYTDSPELLEGEQLQVEYAQKGFTAEVTRVITDAEGETIDTYSVVSNYSPSQNTILRGTASPDSTPEATPAA
jgi:vancomycin resistance protein YoaR